MTTRDLDHWGWEDFALLVGDALREARDDLAGVELRPEHHLVRDLGLDSLDVFEVVLDLEGHLDVGLPPIDVEPTLANLFELTTRASQQRTAADGPGSITIELE